MKTKGTPDFFFMNEEKSIIPAMESICVTGILQAPYSNRYQVVVYNLKQGYRFTPDDAIFFIIH